MIKYRWQFVFMVLVFFLDVRVKADDHKEAHGESNRDKHEEVDHKLSEGHHDDDFSSVERILISPAGCDVLLSECEFLVERGPYKLKTASGVWSFSKGSIVVTKPHAFPVLLRGELLVIATEYNKINLGLANLVVDSGSLLVEKKEKSTLIHNIDALVRTKRRGAVGFEDLPKGFSVDFGSVTVSGMARQGIVKIANYEKILKLWAGLETDRVRYQSVVQNYKKNWRRALQVSSEWYRKAADRKIAAVKAQRLRKKRQKERLARENSRLRSLFRKRLGYDIN